MSILGSRNTRNDSSAGAPALVAFVNDSRTETTIKNLVQEQLMTFTVVRRGTCQNAIAFLRNSASPRMVVVDLANSEVPLSDVDELLSVCGPNVVVIVIGEENDIALYRDLLLLGVADYVVKPVTTEVLRRIISVRLGNNPQNKQGQRVGKVICVTGARGGVGTTTFVSNLGWMLSEESGRRAAIVDLDLQYGAVNMMYGLKKSNGFMEVLKNPHRIDGLFLDRTLSKKSEKLFVLSTEEPLEDDTSFDPDALDAVLEILGQRFHYVIIDLPRRPGPIYRRVLERSAVRIIMANATLTSVRDSIRISMLIGREDLGQRAFLVMNHTTPFNRSAISKADFERAAGRRVDYEIPYAKNALYTDNSGEILAERDPAFADVFRQIINDLSGRPTRKETVIKRIFGQS